MVDDFRGRGGSPWGSPPGGGSGNGSGRRGPTPPFALDTAIVNLVPIIGFLVKVFALVFSIIASLSPLFITMF